MQQIPSKEGLPLDLEVFMSAKEAAGICSGCPCAGAEYRLSLIG
jgi:hypothetical protein